MRSNIHEYYTQAILKATAYIEDHLSEHLDLNLISDVACLSKFHFHRVFKTALGFTVKEYIHRTRIEKAALQLQRSDQAIQDIAYACGFGSPEQFSRSFKTYYRCSPKEFRTRFRETPQFDGFKQFSLSDLGIQYVGIKKLDTLHLAYIRQFGSYDQVAKAYQKLYLWTLRNLSLKLISHTIGIVHDSPNLTSDPYIRFDACVQLRRPIKAKGEVGYKSIQAGKYVVYRYQGPYDQFHPVYDAIYADLLCKNSMVLRDAPALEWYVKGPPFAKPEKYLTDFYVPVE